MGPKTAADLEKGSPDLVQKGAVARACVKPSAFLNSPVDGLAGRGHVKVTPRLAALGSKCPQRQLSWR